MMNNRFFEDYIGDPDILDETNEQSTPPIEPVNRSSANAPVLANLVEQTPTGSGTIPNADSLVGENAHPTQADESPVGEDISQVELPPPPAKPPLPVLVGSPVFKLDSGESQNLRGRWKELQNQFVDDPHQAVRQADVLVSELVDKISRMLASEHSALTMQWKQAGDTSTEDLRILLQRYRSFFNRLLE